MLLLEDSSSNIADFYISEDINNTDLYWLPKNILKCVHIDDLLEFKVCSNKYSITLKYFFKNQMKEIIEYLDKKEFIDFFTILLYHYNDIQDVVSDGEGDPYLYKDLIKADDNLLIRDRLKYWDILEQHN